MTKSRLLVKALMSLFALLLTSSVWAQYCAVTGYVNGSVKISGLQVGSISIRNNTQGGYQDRSSETTKIYKGYKYPLSVTCPAALNPNNCSRWIDWNHDSIFDASERQDLLQFANGALFRDTIIAPAGALPGPARMRTVLFYRQSNRVMNPCASTDPNNDGSVWDVTLHFDTVTNVLPPCTQIITPLDLSTNVLTNTSIRWRLPATGPVLGYRIYLDTLATIRTLVGTTTFDTTFTPAQQLLGGRNYYARVEPYNLFGQALGCDSISFRTTGNPPNCPTVTSPAGGGVTTPRTVDFGWTDNGGNTSTYTILADTVFPPRAILAQGITGLSYRTLVNLIPRQRYYYQVLAVNALGASAGCAIDSINTSDSISYCSVSFQNSNYRISQIQFQTVTDNGVTRSGYFDRRPRTLVAPIGSTQTIDVTISGGNNNNTIYCYIDYNQNGSFTDPGERILATGSDFSKTISVTPPVGAKVGRTTMRIVLWFIGNGPFNAPCGNIQFDGNALDYYIDIQNPLACTGRPSAGTVVLDSARCDNGVGYLRATGTGIASNLRYQWLKRVGTTWAPAGTSNDTTSTLSTSPNASPTSYRFVVTCANSGLTDSTAAYVLSGAPVPAPSVRDTARCGTGGFLLRASSTLTGGTYRWYRGLTGLSADSANNAPISTSTQIRNGVAVGDSVVRYVAYVTAQGCESPRTRVIGWVLAVPTAPSITPTGTQTTCAGDSVTLTAPAGFARYLWSNNATTPSITVKTGGPYSVRVTNAGGCQSPASTVVNVNFTARPNRPTVTFNQTTNRLTATILPNANGLNLAWYLNGVLISGQTTATLTPTAVGNYTVVATRSATPFCVSDTSASVAILVGLEASTNAQQATFAYPNPTTGDLMVQLPVGSADRTLNLILTDLVGKTWMVNTQAADQSTATMRLSIQDVPAGTYMLRLSDGTNAWHQRIVKQ